MDYRYDLNISGLIFRICSPFELCLPECFLPFLIETADGNADFTFIIITGERYDGEGFIQDYQLDTCRKISRIEPNGRDDMAYIMIPSDYAGQFAKSANWLLYMALERQLLNFGRVVIHASAVIYNRSVYVFTAPSGIGKSTQASIWEKYLNAEIINGDKVILHDDGKLLTAYGSPIAGSSGIYKNAGADVAAIIRLDKGSENSVRTLSTLESFLMLYSEAVKSDCDEKFNKKLLETLTDYPSRTRFVRLSCKADQTAADCLLNYLSGL